MLDSLDTLNQRLVYQGGNQEGRFQKDKLTGLKRALLYSYQAQTISFEYEGQEYQFRCLINTDKTKGDYDNKVLSIPYEDIRLNGDRIGTTTEGLTSTLLKPGMTFKWVTTHGEQTHWLIWLQYLEQDSYFRAQIRQCDKQIQINGKKYWVYIRGPVETSIQWNQKASTEWNDLNHSLVMFITRDQNTLDFFHRFKLLKISQGDNVTLRNWQVVGENPYHGDGIIQVFLDEYFENVDEDSRVKQQEQRIAVQQAAKQTAIQTAAPYIDGPTTVRSFTSVNFVAMNCADDGHWYYLKGDKQVDLKCEGRKITLDIKQSKNGKLTLIYRAGARDITLPIIIESVI